MSQIDMGILIFMMIVIIIAFLVFAVCYIGYNDISKENELDIDYTTYKNIKTYQIYSFAEL